MLDIAGGNGQLSFELVNLSNVPTTVVDPRPFSTERWARRMRNGFYHTNELFQAYNVRSLEEALASGPLRPRHFRIFFEEWLWADCDEALRKAAFDESAEAAARITWTRKGLEECDIEPDVVEAPIWEDVICALWHCSTVVGMHPDQAAGAIVDFALHRRIPFALTPCCTYSKQFPRRRLKNGVPVTTYEQLVQFLMEKNSNIRRAELAFEGKNIVLYWHPDYDENPDHETLQL